MSNHLDCQKSILLGHLNSLHGHLRMMNLLKNIHLVIHRKMNRLMNMKSLHYMKVVQLMEHLMIEVHLFRMKFVNHCMKVVMIHMKMNLQNCILLKIVHLMNIHQIVQVKKIAKSNLLVIHCMMSQKNFLLMSMKILNYIHFENYLVMNMMKDHLVQMMQKLFVVLLMNCVLLVQIA